MQIPKYADNAKIRVLHMVDEHRLPFGIALVIAMAMALTALSMWLYVQSGAAGLDLSRPGLSDVRENIQVTNSRTDFSAEGILTLDIVDSYLVEYKQAARQSERLGAFDAQPLSNSVLRFDISEDQLGN